MISSRRTVLRHSIKSAAALGVMGNGLFAPPAYAQKATLFTLVFLSKRLDASTADYRKWYIEHHAPDFLKFGRPFLKRYTQDFVEKAHMGDVDFDCISEFGYRSQGDQEALMKLTATPEAMKILAADPKIGSKPGPHEDHGGPRTFSVDERVLFGPARGYDSPGTRKQGLLLVRRNGVSQKAFAAAAQRFGLSIAHHAKGAVERVVLDAAVPESDRPAPLYDGVITIWPAKGAEGIAAFGEPPAEIEIVNFLDLLSYESNLGAA